MSRLNDLNPPATTAEGQLQRKIADLEARVTELEARQDRIPVESTTPTGPLMDGRIMGSNVGGVRKLWVVMNGTLFSVTLS